MNYCFCNDSSVFICPHLFYILTYCLGIIGNIEIHTVIPYILQMKSNESTLLPSPPPSPPTLATS